MNDSMIKKIAFITLLLVSVIYSQINTRNEYNDAEYKVYGEEYLKFLSYYNTVTYYAERNLTMAEMNLPYLENAANDLAAKNKKYLAVYFNLKGKIEYQKGKYASAINNYSFSLDILSPQSQTLTKKELSNLGYSVIDFANVYFSLDIYNSAEKHYKIAMQYFGMANDSLGCAVALNNIGLIHEEIKDFKSAGMYFNQAYEIRMRWGGADKDFFTGHSFKYIARTKIALRDYNTASELLDSAACSLKRSKYYGAKKTLGEIYQLYLLLPERILSNKDKQVYLNLSENIALKSQDSLGLYDVYLSIAGYYSKRKDFNRAIDYLLRVKELSGRQSKDYAVVALQLSEAYDGLGDIGKKEEYFGVYDSISKSISHTLIESSIADIQDAVKSRNNIVKKEYELKNINKNYFITILALAGLVIIFILVFIFLSYRYRLIKAHQKRLVEIGEKLQLSIDEQKNVEKKILERTVLLAAVSSSMPGGVLVVDHESEQTIFSNETFSNLWDLNLSSIPLGSNSYTLNDILSKCLSLLITPDDFINKVIVPSRTSSTADLIYIELALKNGRVLSCHYSNIIDAANNIFVSLYFFEDITVKKRIEENIKDKLAYTIYLYEIKSRVIGIISHKFRTPMTVIQLSVDLLENYISRGSQEMITLQLHKIQDSILLLREILGNIIILDDTGADKIQPNYREGNLLDLCRKVFASLSRNDIMSGKIDFQYNIEEQNLIIEEALLSLILTNLLDNALKYSYAGSKVGFEVASTPENLIFKIRDEGIGIPESEKEHIYEPFYRAHNSLSFDGLGIGLTIVRQCVDAYGGGITVDSIFEQGTTFTVSVPVIKNTASIPTPKHYIQKGIR